VTAPASGAEIGPDGRELRVAALGEELALRIDDHPAAIVLEAALGGARLGEVDALQALDGIDVERGDGWHARIFACCVQCRP
jgi:hypothetical protein